MFLISLSTSAYLNKGDSTSKFPTIFVFLTVLSVFISKSELILISENSNFSLFLAKLFNKSLSNKNLSIFNFISKEESSLLLSSLKVVFNFIFSSVILISAFLTNFSLSAITVASIFSIFFSNLSGKL